MYSYIYSFILMYCNIFLTNEMIFKWKYRVSDAPGIAVFMCPVTASPSPPTTQCYNFSFILLLFFFFFFFNFFQFCQYFYTFYLPTWGACPRLPRPVMSHRPRLSVCVALHVCRRCRLAPLCPCAIIRRPSTSTTTTLCVLFQFSACRHSRHWCINNGDVWVASSSPGMVVVGGAFCWTGFNCQSVCAGSLGLFSFTFFALGP